MSTALETIRTIQDAAARRFGVEPAWLASERRDRPVIDARWAAMWLCREAGFSYPRIGRAFGRDHSAVMHAVRQTAALVGRQPDWLGPELERLAASLRRGVVLWNGRRA
jgi:chromosomal replication initiation ATPase DnaA